MADIFISYAHEDRDTAKALAQALADRGWSVWWDRHIPSGRRFHDVIERELTVARCVIALWSTAALSSPWVREEAQDGLDRNILVPARIETVQLPIGFRTVQTADLSDWNGSPAHSGFMQFVEDIRAVLGEASPQTPVPESEAKPQRPAEAAYSASLVGTTPLDIESDQPRERAATENAQVHPLAAKPVMRGWRPYLALLGVVTAVGLGYTLHELRAPSPVPERADKPGQTLRDCDICPEMVVVPSGKFTMGSPADEPERNSDEGPQHEVTIAPFAMGKTEVTFGAWDACVAAGGCNGYKPPDEGWGRGSRPVINISWRDAQAYVSWLSQYTGKPYRLLSEAEWEYTARAGTTTPYAFGDAITPKGANSSESKLGKTTEVRAYPPNPWGLYDMHGNVWEWVEDTWHNSYEGAPIDGTAWTDGEGKESSRSRGIRGGSWKDPPSGLRSANRSRVVPDGRNNNLGFRVARTL